MIPLWLLWTLLPASFVGLVMFGLGAFAEGMSDSTEESSGGLFSFAALVCLIAMVAVAGLLIRHYFFT